MAEPLPLRSNLVGPARDLSKAIFGNRYFLEICVALGRDKESYPRALAGATGIPDASLRSPLKRLVDASCASGPPGDEDSATANHKRIDGPIWAFAEKLLARLAEQIPPT